MKTTTDRPKVAVSADSCGVVSQAGGLLLAETARATGLDRALSQVMAPWRSGRVVHDPAKVVADVATALALGGDCLADVAVLRAEPGLYGPVASDPTVSRLLERLASCPDQALTAIRKARAAARERAWTLAGEHSPAAVADGDPLIVDVDATLVTAHSEKEDARPTWKKTFGFHPILAYLDHGPAGTGEPLAGLLRPGNAGSNTAADHIEVTRLALEQLPQQPPQRRVLVRTDAGGGTRAFLDWLSEFEQPISYSIGFGVGDELRQAILAVPSRAWTPAYNTDGHVRDGAWVAEVTGMCALPGWPEGMRVIARKERPHPGAQLTFTDAGGHRFTCFVTNTTGGQLADLELRHRRRARAEDRIRAAKDTGLANLPLHGFAANQIWCELVALAQDLTAWTQTLALTSHDARRWEPKRLRLRLLNTAGRLVRTGRRTLLRLARHWPWASDTVNAITRLQALTAPG